VSSLTYLLSSEGWRQDHNEYSHQMPGFINTFMNKKAKNVRVYLPPDANCLLSTIDHCLTSLGKINLVIGSKQPMPQWLTADEAAEHCVTAELFRLRGRGPAGTRVVSLHLGGGASACALRDGMSLDTSMGLTPLEGLVMSTRCGDLDPGVVVELFRKGMTADQEEELLYRKSGLLGLSGTSGDIRDLEPAAAAGDWRASLALEAAA
jgi:hypothetical protein